MIGTGALVSTVVRAHYTDHGRVLPGYSYMELLYHPADALAVRLAGCGLVAGERTFSRQLIADVLSDGKAGIGSIQFRLTVLPRPVGRTVLMVTLDADEDWAQEFAIWVPEKVGRFLEDTYDLVPPEDECDFVCVEDPVAACLGGS